MMAFILFTLELNPPGAANVVCRLIISEVNQGQIDITSREPHYRFLSLGFKTLDRDK
jgi:hypothetical protein